MNITCIIGTTGVGKTAEATARARRLHAPVIVLDRVQIHSDLAISSGRPSPEEYAGTQRVYLAERPVCDGEMHAEEAVFLLYAHLSRLQNRRDVIIEGGSCSVVRLLHQQGFFRLSNIAECLWLTVADHAAYRRRVEQRVTGMVREGMIEEICTAAQTPEGYANLRTMVGPNVVLEWAAQTGLSLGTLAREAQGAETQNILTRLIVQSHIRYADEQEQCWQTLQQSARMRPGTRPLQSGLLAGMSWGARA